MECGLSVWCGVMLCNGEWLLYASRYTDLEQGKRRHGIVCVCVCVDGRGIVGVWRGAGPSLLLDQACLQWHAAELPSLPC